MNKNTIHSIKNIFFLKIFFAVILLCTNNLYSQVGQQGTLHIEKDTYFYIGSGATDFTFGASPTAATTTNRTATSGKLMFADAISLLGVTSSPGTGHFVDGFVSTFSTGSFTFPIGDNGSYRPATVSDISNNTIETSGGLGINGAYYEINPTTIDANKNVAVTQLSNKEYWEISSASASASAKITLSWDANSDVAGLIANLSDLSIVGWDGIEWVEVPSTYVDGSTLASGTIITDAAVSLTGTMKYYTLGAVPVINPCLDLPIAAGSGVSWELTGWTPDVVPPTLTDVVTINAPYPGGSFVCNSLVLNADVTLLDGQVLEIVYGVTGGSKIIMANTSSLIQRDGFAAAPTIFLTKETRPLRRDDYTYFGSPINPTGLVPYGNLITQLGDAQASTGTLKGALNGMYSLLSGDAPAWQNLTTIKIGEGFTAKITNQAPFGYHPPASNPPATWNVLDYDFDYVNVPIKGIANNGDYPVTITKSTNALADYEGNYILLANPYPSALYADLFLEENQSVIDGVVYLWRASSQNAQTITYNQSNYIAYTKLGTTYTGPSSVTDLTFDGKIASGQGFLVRAYANGTVNFNNCMRLVSPLSNANFQKTKGGKAAAKKVVDRFKLSLTNVNGVYSQILIGYLPECTYQFDKMYDAPRNSVSTSQLFTTLDDGQKLAINGRPTFSLTDVVPLGFTKTGTKIENYNISISEKEGVFNGSTVKVYLYDKLFDVYHNFENGDYSFSTNAENLLDRFSVVYSDATLSNPDFDKSRFTTYIKNEVLYLNSSNEMSSAEVFDISGKIIDSFKVNDVLNYTRKFNHAEAVYIVKVRFLNGMITNQKLINKN
ncbi:MAG TPA: hypothetical protein DCS19_04720 [Flavobacterium sp.]|nr:hypothetical protein [Flavobacterium sp.]